MHFSVSFVLAALPFLTSASTQLDARQDLGGTFTLTAIHSGDESVHNQPIVASDEHFYIGKTSSAKCNVKSPTPCQAVTEINVNDTRAALNVAVPGGQTVFVDTTYALAFTLPHDDSIAGEDDGFSLVPNASDQSASVHNLFWRGNGPYPIEWLACPIESNNQTIYQIFANTSDVQPSSTSVTHCHDIAIALTPGNYSAMPFEFS